MEIRLSPKSEAISENVVLAIYSLLVGIGLYYHEPWFDEIQAWQIAASSSSLPALLNNLEYEGHPFLWHLLLMGVQLFTDDLVGMQVLHGIIAFLMTFVLVKKSPFPLVFRLIVPFTAMFLYEYAIISRPYGLVTLLTFLCAHHFNKPRYLFLWCVLLSQLHANAIVISGLVWSLSLVYANANNRKILWYYSSPLAIAICLSLVIMKLGDDTFVYEKVEGLSQYLLKGANVFTIAFIPIADLSVEKIQSYWFNNIIFDYNLWVALLFSTLSLIVTGILFVNRIPFLFAICVFCISLLLPSSVLLPTYRYAFLLITVLLCFSWIERKLPAIPADHKWKIPYTIPPKTILFTSLFFIQVMVSISIFSPFFEFQLRWLLLISLLNATIISLTFHGSFSSSFPQKIVITFVLLFSTFQGFFLLVNDIQKPFFYTNILKEWYLESNEKESIIICDDTSQISILSYITKRNFYNVDSESYDPYSKWVVRKKNHTELLFETAKNLLKEGKRVLLTFNDDISGKQVWQYYQTSQNDLILTPIFRENAYFFANQALVIYKVEMRN